MKKILILLSVLFLTGCSHNLRMEHSSLDLKVELDKSQYEIVGNVEGEASTKWLLLVYFPIRFSLYRKSKTSLLREFLF